MTIKKRRIEYYAAARGLSWGEIADRFGVSRETLRRWRDSENWSPANANFLAQILQVELEDLK